MKANYIQKSALFNLP